MPEQPKVAIIIPNYNGREFLRACIESLTAQDYPDFSITVVDNASTDGSAELVRGRFPDVRLIENSTNTGFAGGCNSGLKRELGGDASLFVLLNSDTRAAPGWLATLVRAMMSDPDIGICQSLVLIAGSPGVVNTAGNECHYLGFGYCGHYMEEDRGQFAGVSDIPFASGTALMVRRETLDDVGLMDEELFLYQEDLDLSWRARMAGWRVVLAGDSLIDHEYSFSRNPEKFYYLERNRLAVCLKNYRVRTLLVLAPAFLGAELAMLGYSLAGGWAGRKLRGYLYLLRNIGPIIDRRREAQRRRRTGDRKIVAHWTDRMGFDDLKDSSLTRVANPVSALYWKLARRLIR